jgi:hypothetical protein
MATIDIVTWWNRRARSSSILEVTVALVVISITFGLFMMTYINLLAGNYYLQKLKYEGKLSIQLQELIQSKKFVNDVKEEGQVRIFQTVSRYKDSRSLKWIELKAINSKGKILAEYNSLYYDVSP